MQERNQEVTFFLVDDDLYVEAPGLRGALRFPDSRALFPGSVAFLDSKSFLRESDEAPPVEAPVFKFGRMFRNPELPEYRPKENGLIELGLDMGEEVSPGDNPDLPAGYVYLGQFIDHDLSFNAMTNRLPLGVGSLQDEKSLRSPSLDLDSLYGLDTPAFRQTELGGKVYEDEARLRVGQTIDDADVPGLPPPLPNDLPREGDPKKREAAAVADPRNDENLVVAQTHLAFVKFHNAVVKALPETLTGEALFDAAREQVVRHYQWVILRDYLPKVIEGSVLEEVIENGCTYLQFGEESASVPFEFAMAAFRFGHTQVNHKYEWNRVFQSQPPGFFSASLNDLFTFTGFRQMKLLNRLRLPSSWIIDWTRFFDFQDIHEVTNSQHSNRARKICPSVIAGMISLRPFMTDEEKLMAVLPVRNLLRGRFLGLPAGQCVARRIGVAELTPDQIKEGASERRREILERYGLDQLTPLWYYILKEAEKHHEGRCLGPVGSRIVAETFVELIRKSRVSILPPVKGKPVWEPKGLGVREGHFSMPDLLSFVDRTLGNHINPLGN